MDRCWSPRRVRATPGVLLPGARVTAGSSRNPPAPASKLAKRLAPPRGGRGSPLDPGATSDTDLFEDGRDRQHVAGCEDVAQASFQQVVVLGVLGPLLHPARDARRVTRREVLGDVAADQGSTLDLPAQHLVHAPVVVPEPSLIGVLPRR